MGAMIFGTPSVIEGIAPMRYIGLGRSGMPLPVLRHSTNELFSHSLGAGS